ncbi:structure-specific endonuclease subunit SLX1 [Histomonas meleagridis]|uniref:structure-specific endonuclease subunit SLX1 n=1 Tax=Histomonas meleagridis TaxID=135588 RepID=UPI003559E73E|nr:structure-specific endonuclease subunit SLX1 [Histomonas meleagridis]KAH0801488.1 structure-specific endonuclease subunit SLX1 [Histomonas meleagridis]
MESFSGCYLLRSKNPSYKSACYVGFTVNPPHRLKQHNGEIVGGAFKTHSKRPWEMTIVVYGFSTRKHALRFEWTWQHPTESKNLKHVDWNLIFQTHGGPRNYKTHIRIFKEMLNSKPWVRLSLRICVTCSDVLQMLNSSPKINENHSVYLGKLEDLPIHGTTAPSPACDVPDRCLLCVNSDAPPYPHPNWVICPFCGAFLHLRCLAKQFISQSPRKGASLIPTRGTCPACLESLSWRDLVELRNQLEPDLNDGVLQISINKNTET